jgi:amino acid adenylation domain-containing protein/non-ribosomal peptide synthase protein (TIGR01720 family)
MIALDDKLDAPWAPGEDRYIFPASFAQQRLWFLEQFAPGSAMYHVPAAMRLCGALDVALLHESCDELIRRHEVLRTTFSSRHHSPVQVVAAELKLAMPLLDLRDTPKEEREERALLLARQEAARPFDLERGPLLRVLLIRLDALEHLFVCTMHHGISDAWSRGIVLQELMAIYVAFAAGQPSPLPELPIQYADFALWQREWLQGPILEQQLAYWRDQLRGAPPLLQLPTDRPRPASQTHAGAVHRFMIDARLAAALRSLGRRAGATLFMTLLAAFQTLLMRLSGQQDIVVGTPIANRTVAETESLIGFFVNTLVLRTSLAGAPCFMELLRRVRETTLGAYEHQDLPFEILVDSLRPARSLHYTPFFQVMFVLHNAPLPRCRLPNLRMQLEPLDLPVAQFDLTLAVSEEKNHLAAAIEYSTDLFDAGTIERLAGYLRTLAEAIVEHPDLPIARLPLFSAQERQQIVRAFNETHRAVQFACLHTLFEQQAARAPDAVALEWAGRHMTYYELNRHANQLARWLLRRGIRRETYVGICLERSPELIVGMLAVLKAGAVYVPLDPSYPGDRLRYMVEDAGIPLILGDQQIQDRLRLDRVELVCLERWPEIYASMPEENPACAVGIDQLAYVIYTSGSAGRPKGVLIPHRGIGNLAQAQIDAFDVRPGSRILQSASLNFDASVAEIVVALLAGATLCLASKYELLPGDDLLDTLRTRAISTVTLSPSQLAALPAAQLDDLATLVSAGEACSADLVERWAAGRRFLNAYGPTEGTVCATIGRCRPGQAAPAIGRPIDNVQVYILDRELQPVPCGVIGELHIGGLGLARGYLKRPDLTAERFIPNPFLKDEGERMKDEEDFFILHPSSFILYKTGDLGRYRADGSIEYAGRADDQVKIRGFRIEPGEVEATLAQHPCVHAAAVVDRIGDDGEKRLVAYVVPTRGQGTGDRGQEGVDSDTASLSPITYHLSPGELRAFLKERLPEYMLPSAFVVVEALPLTANGKIDRQALPAPTRDRRPSTSFVAPRRREEQLLADIWADALGLSRVSIHDNFFDLGGDSFLVIQVTSRANTAGLHLTPRLLFQHQTIAALAAAAAVRHAIAEKEDSAGQAPLMPSQQWFFEQDFPPPYNWTMTTLLELPGDFAIDRLDQALRHVVGHHDALRLRFRRTAPHTYEQWVDEPDKSAARCLPIDASAVPDDQFECFVAGRAAELQRSLDLEQGHLLRVALFTGKGPARLLIILHHLAGDTISFDIFLQDLLAAYQQLAQGQAVQLQRSASFKSWAERIHSYAESEGLRREWDEYWLKLPWHELAPLPIDYPENRPKNSVASATSVSTSLSREETNRLAKILPASSPYQVRDVLLAALLSAYAAWTGRRALLVDAIINGRTTTIADRDLSRTIGWLALCPRVLLRSERGAPFEDVLETVYRQLNGLPSDGIGYQVLRHLGRDPLVKQQLERLPPAEIIFNYLGPLGDGAHHPALPIRVAPEFRGVAAIKEDAARTRHILLTCCAFVQQDQLHIALEYSQALHRRATIQQLVDGIAQTIRTFLVAHRTEDGGWEGLEEVVPPPNLPQNPCGGPLVPIHSSQ